jgi:glycosyltransferase involved in cell wall biosynthesis
VLISNLNKKNRKCSKVLFLATVDSHICYFHIPFMKLLRGMGYEVEVAASNVGFTERIEKEGFKVNTIPFSRNPLSFSNVKSFFMLYHLIKKEKYIMIHTHTPVASFVGRIAAKLAGVPHIVYTAHGFHFHEHGSKLKNFVYYRLEKFAGRFTDVLITINKDDFEIVKAKSIVPKGKVFYIKGVGVDTKKLNPKNVSESDKKEIKEKFSLSAETHVIVSVGRLEREKHFEHLIEALRIVKEKEVRFKFFIAGNGPLSSSLLKVAKSFGLEEELVLLGHIDEISNLLSLSDVYVTASLREGLPVSVMEAMAMEKPVVAYNIRGVRDLVEDGVNGFLVPFGDVNGLAEKILYLMKHPEVAEEMGKKGREKVEREFSLNIILPQMEKLYREILEAEERFEK